MKNVVGKAIAILLLISILIVPSGEISYAKEKQKDYSSITSTAHTFFFKNKRNEEISLYFSTIEKDKENREKVFEITLYLYKAIIGEGYKEIPANHPILPINIIFIDIIQQPEGVVIVITKGGKSIWKLFTISPSNDIINEVMLKISGVEV